MKFIWNIFFWLFICIYLVKDHGKSPYSKIKLKFLIKNFSKCNERRLKYKKVKKICENSSVHLLWKEKGQEKEANKRTDGNELQKRFEDRLLYFITTCWVQRKK